MATGPAARVTDSVMHPLPPVLGPGPGSINVLIGNLPAWRGVPAMAAAGLQAAKNASDATLKAAAAATQAAMGTPGAPAAVAAEQTAKASAAAAMGATITASAGGADIHVCGTPLPAPPHGPGVVIDGSPTVLINNLPACRQTDTILEAVGPPNKIVKGLTSVIIGGTATGAAPNGPYDSLDEAARAALQLANPQSIQANLEYSGLIYQGADGKFYFTGPAQGTDQGANPLTQAPAPPGATVVGDYHTHAAYSLQDPATGDAIRTDDPARDGFNSDNFSGQDKSDSNTQGYPGYLGTPSGTFRKYDPATGADTTL
ncbi:MAG: DUF4329 domain-containing protein [Bryobacteraceae bacterium]